MTRLKKISQGCYDEVYNIVKGNTFQVSFNRIFPKYLNDKNQLGWFTVDDKWIAQYLTDLFPGPLNAAQALMKGKTVINDLMWLRLKK